MIEQNMCIKRQKSKETVITILKSVFCISILFISVIFAEKIKEGVIYGIRLSALCVIPSVFPFFVLSDIICTIRLPSGKLAKGFERLIGVRGELFDCFIFSTVCGFAVGAKLCSEKGRTVFLSKNEMANALFLCSNPSLGFCIGAVGAVCFSSVEAGLLLFCSMLSATIITGLLFREKDVVKSSYYENSDNILRQKFDFATSIKNAALASLSVSSFIIFFSAIVSLIEGLNIGELPLAIISSVFEVGNACARLSALDLPRTLSFPLCGFALGFSGLSVILQARSSTRYSIPFGRMFLFKLTEGVLCAAFSLALFCIIPV